MINFNGQLYPTLSPLLSPANRAFRYGDSLFESIRMTAGEMPFLERHLERLHRGMAILKMQPLPSFSLEFLRGEIKKVARRNARIRLTVFRAGAGLYTPETHHIAFLIEAQPLSDAVFELNPEGYRAGLAKNVCFYPTPWSFCKTGNSLVPVLAGIERRERGWDEILVKNTSGRIACGGSSNIFIRKQDELTTPPLSEGCVAGVMRSVVQELVQKTSLVLREAPLSLEDFDNAEEVILTNAVRGIRWVEQVEGIGKTFGNACSRELIQLLNDHIAG